MKILYILIGILFTLLFVGGPDYESRRVVQYAWDTGHLFLFSAVAYALLSSRIIKVQNQLKVITIIASASLVIGFLIEVVQLFFHRDFEIHDVINDMLGALIGYVFFRITEDKKPVARQKRNIAVLIILILCGFYQLLGVIVDEFMMRQEFPVLADFEYSNQLSRWDTKRTEISLSKKYVREGQFSLKVNFLPDEFPDVTLQHFPHDWSGYRNIGFSLFNPAANGPLTIELKIYDKAHIKNGYPYNDRFNHEFLLHPGWNDIVLSLAEVFKSPASRVMNKKQVKSFSLFLNNVSEPLTIYMDNLKLF